MEHQNDLQRLREIVAELRRAREALNETRWELGELLERVIRSRNLRLTSSFREAGPPAPPDDGRKAADGT